MELKKHNTAQIHSFLALRKAVGWIGIVLPFVLMLGVILIFKGMMIQASISEYYYTGMRDVLVGALCAIALFLFFYRGYSRLDNWAANVAGFFAVCIAWFPTTQAGPSDFVGIIHFISATIFFLILAFFSLFLFTRKGSDPTQQKIKRNRIYIVCGIIMLGCLVGIVIFFNFFEKGHPRSSFVFWAETIALVAFGVSWLIKGETLYRDKK